jgi:hypothetical protein
MPNSAIISIVAIILAWLSAIATWIYELNTTNFFGFRHFGYGLAAGLIIFFLTVRVMTPIFHRSR